MFEELIVFQFVKKNPYFMEPANSLPFLQQAATDHHPAAGDSTPNRPVLYQSTYQASKLMVKTYCARTSTFIVHLSRSTYVRRRCSMARRPYSYVQRGLCLS
jgi:hypothetical protein